LEKRIVVAGDATHQCGARGMTPVSPSAGRKKRDLNPRARSAVSNVFYFSGFCEFLLHGEQ